MDEVTKRVHDMYSRFPYPSSDTNEARLKELANLLSLFAREAKYDFNGKSILDAGSGTGHRLITAAKALKSSSFTAVDMSERSLAIAAETAAASGVTNVTFQRHNLMDEGLSLGKFDLVLCMGVLHHLANPAQGLKNLIAQLKEDGCLFLYLYGLPGSQERMRRKEIVAILRGREIDFGEGVQFVKDLGFDTFDYGWNVNPDHSSCDALIVDMYMNVNERLYDVRSIQELLSGSGLHAFSIYGFTTGQRGYLVDTALGSPSTKSPFVTDVSSFLSKPNIAANYEKLGLVERYRLLELFYQPNGYTVLGLSRKAMDRLETGSRLMRNAVAL